MSETIIYLDVCALKRPFDDARSDRVRREAEGVARIFEKVESGVVRIVASPAHRFENDRNPPEDRRLATDLWLQKAVVAAEASGARWFVTTDDQLLAKARANRERIRVEVVTPDDVTLGGEIQQ